LNGKKKKKKSLKPSRSVKPSKNTAVPTNRSNFWVKKKGKNKPERPVKKNGLGVRVRRKPQLTTKGEFL